MKTRGFFVLFVSSMLIFAGCTTWYESATIEDGLISNPKVGWAGYSVRVPDGLDLIYPLPDGEVSKRAEAFKVWYDDQLGRFEGDYYSAFTERFLMENPERTFILSFRSETYEIAAGWGVVDSVETTYLITKLINRKKVVLNDDDARAEQVEINGLRGWRISGVSRPYFKKGAKESVYEGYFMLGGLREAFWVEGYGVEGSREETRRAAREMVESLVVND